MENQSNQNDSIPAENSKHIDAESANQDSVLASTDPAQSRNDNDDNSKNPAKEHIQENSNNENYKRGQKDESQVVERILTKNDCPQDKSNPIVNDTAPNDISQKECYKKKETQLKEPKMQASIDIEDPLTKVKAPTPETMEKEGLDAKLVDLYPHRHYPAIHPCCNRLLEMRWDIASRQKHLKKLAAVKPTVDFTPPKPYKHLQVKMKKLQMQQDRQQEIYRNNRILLERMSNVIFFEAHNPEIHQTRLKRIESNKVVRERRQMKIDLENKKLVQRLVTQQPLYNHQKLLDERMRNLQYLQNISSFPHKFIKEQKSKVLHLKGSNKKDDEAREKEIKLRAIFTEPKPKEKKRMFPNIRPKTRNNGADQLKDGELLA